MTDPQYKGRSPKRAHIAVEKSHLVDLSHVVEDGLVTYRGLPAGIDSLNIDDTDDGSRPVHSILLGNTIPVCEHLTNLGVPPGKRLALQRGSRQSPWNGHLSGSCIRSFEVVTVHRS